MKKPLVSIILPVYNGGPFLAEAIESILDQTFKDFELIIINDGSTDQSESIIKEYKDTRIRYFVQKNQGLARTLNRGISLSKGAFIARQDQDDISYPQRLQKQVDFLEKHKDIAILGTWAKIYKNTKPTKKSIHHPTSSIELKFEILFVTPFVHSSVMIRQEVFANVGLYSTNSKRQPPEDYELWSRILRKFNGANLAEELLIYRIIGTSMTRDKKRPFNQKVAQISKENFLYLFKLKKPSADIQYLTTTLHDCYDQSHTTIQFSDLRQLIEQAAKIIALQNHVDIKCLDNVVKSKLLIMRLVYFKFKYPYLFKGAKYIMNAIAYE